MKLFRVICVCLWYAFLIFGSLSIFILPNEHTHRYYGTVVGGKVYSVQTKTCKHGFSSSCESQDCKSKVDTTEYLFTYKDDSGIEHPSSNIREKYIPDDFAKDKLLQGIVYSPNKMSIFTCLFAICISCLVIEFLLLIMLTIENSSACLDCPIFFCPSKHHNILKSYFSRREYLIKKLYSRLKYWYLLDFKHYGIIKK